jgi:hypothetical protein
MMDMASFHSNSANKEEIRKYCISQLWLRGGHQTSRAK